MKRGQGRWRGALGLGIAAAWMAPALAGAPARLSDDVRLLPFVREVQRPVGFVAADSIWAEVWDDTSLALATAPDFADLRLVDSLGVAQPFARRPPALVDGWDEPAGVNLQWRRAGGDETVRLDFGGRRCRNLVLRVPPEWAPQPLAAEASQDSLTWRDVPLPAAQPGPGAAPTNLVLGAFTERFLRITAAHRGSRGASSASRTLGVFDRVERPTPRVPRKFYVPRARFEGREWIAEAELRGPPVAVCRVVFSLPVAFAQHDLVIEGRRADGGWRELARPRIAVAPGSGDSRRVAVEFEPYRTAALRIHVADADAPNAPVEVDSILSTPYRFAFPYPAARRWFAYGDPHVVAADSRLEASLAARTAFTHLQLGKPRANPHHQAPGFGLAWLQRHPAAVGAALVGILALVAVLVLRPGRRAG